MGENQNLKNGDWEGNQVVGNFIHLCFFYLKKNNYPKDKVYIDGLDTKVTNIAESLSNFRLFKSWVLSTF